MSAQTYKVPDRSIHPKKQPAPGLLCGLNGSALGRGVDGIFVGMYRDTLLGHLLGAA